MSRPLPVELRGRVVKSVENEGLSIREAAQRFDVGTASVKRWLRRSRESGSVEPEPMGGLRVVWIGVEERQQLIDLVEAMADATLDELADAYNARHETAVSRSSLMRALKRFGITRKKSRSEPQRRKRLASPTPATRLRTSSR